MNAFQIAQINYELIRNVTGLSFSQKKKLLGNPDKFVIVQKTQEGLIALFDTIGTHEECVEFLNKINKDFFE